MPGRSLHRPTAAHATLKRAGRAAVARILIVEDETQVLLLAEAVLKEAGHDTRSAAIVVGASLSGVRATIAATNKFAYRPK